MNHDDEDEEYLTIQEAAALLRVPVASCAGGAANALGHPVARSAATCDTANEDFSDGPRGKDARQRPAGRRVLVRDLGAVVATDRCATT